MWTRLGFDPATILILVAGLLGGLTRALVTKNQLFFSKQTIVDAVTSAGIGVVLVGFGLLPGDWKPVYQGAAILIVTYASSDLVGNIVSRLNIFPQAQNRRASDKPEDAPK